ncbi:GNAT superfamily N-acetyltransferase [Catenuloplanes nepalensis]|uniref:GNAT superfamily N-acetyltransferase n=1 Tax=Catenuloplanes nepalensis TaxID=587533 RepID=A0ABT9MME0_9ACTN|nr:GNAT family N-acetyltransferase [Catenuloplanes nepalensis]MDP9792579.1 GNAT superfamily N-acetyltransferase [Catenuloplanes nepalensis]
MVANRRGKARRREPVRHSIPESRLRADHSVNRTVTAQALIDGWAIPGSHVRVRLARPVDLAALRTFAEMAGTRVEDEVADAIDAGIAGAGLIIGMRDGHETFLSHVAEQFFTHQDTGRQVAFLHLTLALVAEDPGRGIVGALLAYPPVGVIGQFLAQAHRIGVNPQQLLVTGAIGLVRVKALAVAEPMRRQGLAAALMECCRQVYATCKYLMLYGQMPARPGLADFYRSLGFTVLQKREGFDPWVIFGVHSQILPESDERMFLWDRPMTHRIQRHR